MDIQKLIQKIPDTAKDIRLNLDSLFSANGSPGLSENQFAGVALACAYATLDSEIINTIEKHFSKVEEKVRQAALSATSIMAMNNVYYRFIHLSDNKEFEKLPAKLRMNIIARPGVDKIDFELMCLAVSALSGCGLCINSHVSELLQAGVKIEGIQSVVRVAAILNAVKVSLGISRVNILK